MKTVTVIGAGRAGGALSIALSRAGFLVKVLVYHTRKPPPTVVDNLGPDTSIIHFAALDSLISDIIILAVRDSEIEGMAAKIADLLQKDSTLFHLSGALASSILSPAASKGAATGSIHPLVSISDPAKGETIFRGAHFCIEGVPRAVAVAEDVVHRLGGRTFTVKGKFKPLYHASAVLASGHVTALFETAVRSLSECGLPRNEAIQVLRPLLNTAVRNLEEAPPEKALTGPFARADLSIVEKHLDALESAGLDEIKRIYLVLGLVASDLAFEGGSDAVAIDAIRGRIKIALESGKC